MNDLSIHATIITINDSIITCLNVHQTMLQLLIVTICWRLFFIAGTEH